MEVFTIIIGIFLVMICSFWISNKIGVRKRQNETKEIFLAHEKLKFPKLSKKTQLEIMVTGEVSSIAELVPEFKDKRVPRELLKRYITISKVELRDYLIETGYIEKQKIENAHNPQHDGIWLMKDKIIDQERGYVHRTWNVKNLKEASEVYVGLLWEKLT